MPNTENETNNGKKKDLENENPEILPNENSPNSSPYNDEFTSTMQGDLNHTNIAKVAVPKDIDVPNNSIPLKKKVNGTKPPKRTMLRILILCLVIVAGLAGVYLYSFMQNEKYLETIDTENFYNGIFIDDIHVGGLTKQQALDKIHAQQVINEQEIKVTVTWDENEEYVYTGEDVDITYDTYDIINKAHALGRSGTNIERYTVVIDLQTNNVRFMVTRVVDFSKLEDEVRSIATSKVETVSEPAVVFTPNKDIPENEWFSYSDSITGIETDDEALWRSVISEFADETYGVVPVPKWEILPDENIDFREITQLIASFKTVQARNANREHNIALCCSMLSGTVLMPGEEFSMNDTTGKRTKEKGFKEANTIVGGNELVPGIAGGVCQVSGTLFNAALLADLEITQRYHHSFELGYLKRGRDATVNYGTADLKFINNHDYPIYIAMFTDGLDVYAQIYGAPLTNCDHITIWVKTTKVTPIGDPIYVKDATVPAGSAPEYLKGHQGISCQVYKIYKDADGNQISSVLSHTDVYRYYAPELHVNPVDYEGYVNPTPTPTIKPTPEPTSEATPEPTDDSGIG